jgi:hypothetical protein
VNSVWIYEGLADKLNSLIHIIHAQMFAHETQIMLRASGNNDFTFSLSAKRVVSLMNGATRCGVIGSHSHTPLPPGVSPEFPEFLQYSHPHQSFTVEGTNSKNRCWLVTRRMPFVLAVLLSNKSF